jgi:hypothetical protein
MAGKTRVVYLVLRSSWYYNDEYNAYYDEPVKAFTDRAEAEAYKARCERREQWGRVQTSPEDYPADPHGYEVVETELEV